MKNLEALRALLTANGVIASDRGQANSMEIVPVLNDLIGTVPLFQDKPPDPNQEGGSCTMCTTSCQNSCQSGCPNGCNSGCESGCTGCCQM